MVIVHVLIAGSLSKTVEFKNKIQLHKNKKLKY